MDEKKNRNGNESGQPVRAAPFHGKKKYTARLYRKKSKDLSGLGKRVTDSVVQKQVVQNEEQETKAENEKLSSELLDAGKLSADRGRNLVRRTVIRRKKYSDRSKKLKKRENDADGLQRLKFENETVKNGKSNQKEQVKHFWKKKRQIRAFKESGNTIYETGTAGNVTLSNTKKLKGMLKRVFSGSKRTKMAVFSIGLIFFLLITSLGSCSSVIQGVGALVISTTYPSSDEAIYAVENHYKELEASLNQQINEMEKKHPGYEEYRYQIDEITHNPYPYVWGGASPETSFDCSGFVCWVINHCGNGWSVGRMTAEGLRGACTYVSPQNAKPGDLIFFEKTYETVGASHVGIYVGDGMMIHCGDPIQYTSINSAYWQEHFLGFGRLP